MNQVCLWGSRKELSFIDGLLRRWGRKPPERLVISFDLFAIRHISLACSHKCMHLTAASDKFILEGSNRVSWRKLSWLTGWEHHVDYTKDCTSKNQSGLPSKELEVVVWLMHVIPDEITHLELLSPVLKHRELLNCLRCQTSFYLQITTVVLAVLYLQIFAPANSGWIQF